MTKYADDDTEYEIAEESYDEQSESMENELFGEAAILTKENRKSANNSSEINVEFSCTKYESIQINRAAKALLGKYKILANTLNFYNEHSSTSTTDSSLGNCTAFGYNPKTGKLEDGF